MRHSGARRALCASAMAVAATMLVLSIVGCGTSSDDGYQGIVRTPPFTTGSTTLPDVTTGGGREAPLRATASDVRLLYFGYTHCPDVCPTTLTDIGAALKELTPAQRARVQTAMVTVDPSRDTGKVLNGYLKHFVDRFAAFRTTDPAQLRRAERRFGASHAKGAVDKDGNYDMSHTAWVYAVDRRGVSRVQWAFGTKPDVIAHDLRRLLDETRPS